MSKQYLLFESAAGYGLFERIESEEIGEEVDAVQKSAVDISKFKKMVKLVSFLPFSSAENALENVNAVSEGIMTDMLKQFLENNLPKVKSKKSATFQLAVQEDKLAVSIEEALNYSILKNQVMKLLMRGLRLHFAKLVGMNNEDLIKAQLGLGHSFSRCKVKFNVHRVDNMIIQSISLLDQIDKDLNVFAMRVREWYSWHFPELYRIIPENVMYAKLIKKIKNKTSLTEEMLPQIEEITMDPLKAKEILEAAKISMGLDISEIDMENILAFAKRVTSLAKYRNKLTAYLVKKMTDIAPNLTELVGVQVGARLIAHAGSLTNLAKYPASTVQILGAEKALFRALKTKGNTPKYGLIFHSSFVGKASQKNKGRISRFLANKCSAASRIDCFAENPTNLFGKKLKEMVEERLKFYDTGVTPQKNIDAMKEVKDLLGDKNDSMEVDEAEQKPKKADTPTKSKKREREESSESEDEPPKKKNKGEKSKKDKKEGKSPKKSKKEESSSEEEEKTPKKKKQEKEEKKTPSKKKNKSKEESSSDEDEEKASKKKSKKKSKKSKKEKKAKSDSSDSD